MDEAPAVVEQGSERPEYQGMTMRDVTFGYGSGARISGERTPNGRSERATGMSPARPAEAQSSGEQGAGIASQPVLDHVSLRLFHGMGIRRYSRPVRAWKINDVETADAILGSGFRHDFAVGCSIATG